MVPAVTSHGNVLLNIVIAHAPRALVKRHYFGYAIAQVRAYHVEIAVLNLRVLRIVLRRIGHDEYGQHPERRKRRRDAVGRTLTDAEHGNDRRRADDHAEHREDAARAVAPEGRRRF